jgi:hypothetical protein
MLARKPCTPAVQKRYVTIMPEMPEMVVSARPFLSIMLKEDVIIP